MEDTNQITLSFQLEDKQQHAVNPEKSFIFKFSCYN